MVTECTKSSAETSVHNTYSPPTLPFLQLTFGKLVLGTWAVAFGGGYLATRKKDEKALKEGSKIPAATADPEEAKFIEYPHIFRVVGILG